MVILPPPPSAGPLTLDAWAMILTIFVEGFIDMITMHLVFLPHFLGEEKKMFENIAFVLHI